MNEQELNDAIDALCAQWIDGGPFSVSWEGKPIPYIGWYWRYVHFDSEQWEPHRLGIIHSRMSDNRGNLVGFMESNKWGYPEFEVPDQEWKELRAIIVDCATAPSAEKCQAVFDKLQSLCPIL